MRDIGKNIRAMRIKRNMTQDEMAERLFVTRQTVSNYETGRSRPDVDMLASMAELLDTDINALIYGEKKEKIKYKEKKQLEFSIITTALLALFYFILLGPAKRLHYNEYILGPLLFLQFVVLPVCYVLSAWTVMKLLGFLTGAKPLQLRWNRYIRIGVYALLLLYFALMLPTVYHGIKSIMVNAYVDSIRDDMLLYVFSSSSGFALSPKWLSRIFGDLWLFISDRTYVFLLFGLMLWLFDFPQKKEKNWIPIVVAFVLSFLIYFCADEEFIIEVHDPSKLGAVPYGIEVIQRDMPAPEWEIN